MRADMGSSLAGGPIIPQLGPLLDAAKASRLLTVAGPQTWAPSRKTAGGAAHDRFARTSGQPLDLAVTRPGLEEAGARRVSSSPWFTPVTGATSPRCSRPCRGLGAAQPMQANTPTAYLPQLRTLLLEEAPGETARTALQRDVDGVGEKAARGPKVATGAGCATPRGCSLQGSGLGSLSEAACAPTARPDAATLWRDAW